MPNIDTTLPTIGTPIPAQGGTLAAIVARADDSTYGLIVADAVHERAGRWGEYGQRVAGAKGTHGATSTQAMAEAGSALAQQVLALTIDGHSDWYIPSRLELLSAYEHARQLFNTDSYYWSSTQYSSNSAWCQDFEYGYSDAHSKGGEFRARPVRSIQLQPFNPSALEEAPAVDPIGQADSREFLKGALATEGGAA